MPGRGCLDRRVNARARLLVHFLRRFQLLKVAHARCHRMVSSKKPPPQIVTLFRIWGMEAHFAAPALPKPKSGIAFYPRPRQLIRQPRHLRRHRHQLSSRRRLKWLHSSCRPVSLPRCPAPPGAGPGLLPNKRPSEHDRIGQPPRGSLVWIFCASGAVFFIILLSRVRMRSPNPNCNRLLSPNLNGRTA